MVLLCASFGGATRQEIAAQQIRDFELKAVYLYRFLSYAQWPAGALDGVDDPYTIGVLGQDPFEGALDELVGRTINGRSVIATHFARLEDLEPTHVLYISTSERLRVREILRAVGQSATLTVSDLPDFIASGGMIRFLTRDSRLRIEVSRCAAERADLRLSAAMLRLATISSSSCAAGGP